MRASGMLRQSLTRYAQLFLVPLQYEAAERLHQITVSLEDGQMDLFDPAVCEEGYRLWLDVLHAVTLRLERVWDLVVVVTHAIDELDPEEVARRRVSPAWGATA